jgi:hypothetical protein
MLALLETRHILHVSRIRVKLPLKPLVPYECGGGRVSSRGRFVTNKPTTAGNTSTSAFIRNQRLQRQFKGAPDDGRNSGRNMLSSVYAT